MKRFKIGALSLACLAGLSLAACGNGNSNESQTVGDSTPTADVTQNQQDESGFPIINMDKVDNSQQFALERMFFDTSNTKLDYYLGDKIDLSGLKVTCSYVRYQPAFERIQKEVTDYYYDTSSIDMTTVGDKLIEVYYREGVNVASDYITIHVKSSALEVSGKQYAAGIVCDVAVQEFLLDSTFTKPIINNITIHYFTGTTETETKTVPLRKCETEFEYEVGDKLTKVGDYMYKVKFKETLQIDGKDYVNEVCTYIVIRVKNDITGIKFNSGSTTLSASAKGLDFSDWKFDVTREVGGTTVEAYDPAKFAIRSVNSLIPGDYSAYIENIESGKGCSVDVKVEASSTQNITIGSEFQETMTEKDENGRIYLDENHIFFVDNAVKTEVKAGSYGSLVFDTRITIKGTGKFGINMSAPGTIVIYIASSGDEIREINFLDKDLTTLETYYTSGTKQDIKEYIVDVTEAGTYYFTVPSQGYVHGAIAAIDKQ